MIKTASIKSVVEELYGLHRTLISEGFDEGLEILRRRLPAAAGFSIEEFPCGAERWTWEVPRRYRVEEAFLEIEGGRRIADFKENCLHLVSYSEPVDLTLTFDELRPRLHYSEKRPDAIPWMFKYYDKTWGFCLSKKVFDSLPRDKRYRAVIRARFLDAPGLKVGVGLLHPEGGPPPGGEEVVVSAHLCHPRQANDNASAVAVGVELANRLARAPLPPGSASVRFLFQPETVGTICWMSGHEDLIGKIRAAVILESIGNRNSLAVQRSWPGGAVIDRVTDAVVPKIAPGARLLDAWAIFSADEKVLNGPGVGIPSIMMTRAPYDEYHTSDDAPDIIDEAMLEEAVRAAEAVVRIVASDYYPKRNFKGPVHLSRHGLWIDHHQDRPRSLLNQKLMLHFEGRLSLFEISEELGADYWTVRELAERYRAKGLMSALPRAESA